MMAQRQSLPAYRQREDIVQTIRDNQVRKRKPEPYRSIDIIRVVVVRNHRVVCPV